MRKPTVDIVVATRNRPRDLSTLLDSFCRLPGTNVSLFVVDQSDDTTENERSIDQRNDHRITYIPHRSRGKTKALNHAIRISDGKYIAFTDDDCEFDPPWISSALNTLEQHANIGLLFGSVAASTHNPTTHFIPASVFDTYTLIKGPTARSYQSIGMGANMFLARSTLERVGLFDEDLGPGGPLHTGEELDLAYRILRIGYDVIQDPSTIVRHNGARPWSQGVAAKLINTSFFAAGCAYGKGMRAGDWRLILVAIHELVRMLGYIFSTLRTGRPRVRRLLAFLRGLTVGFYRGPQYPMGAVSTSDRQLVNRRLA